MEKFCAKEIRRKLAVIICVSLIITAIFQNTSPVNAESSEENVFYLDCISVSADDPSSVSGNSIKIGGEVFTIDQNGKIINSNNISGVSVSGNDGLVWKNTGSESLIIVYPEDEYYFGSDPKTISGNDRSAVRIMLYKKHTINAKVYIQTAEDAYYEVTDAQITYTNKDDLSQMIDQAGAPVFVRKNNNGYQAKATLGGVTGIVDAELDTEENNPSRIEFRGYAKYGEEGDFLLIGKDGRPIENIVADQYYSVGKIVINGQECSQNNPFDNFKLTIKNAADQSIISEKSANIETTSKEITSVSSGDAEIVFNITDYTLLSESNKVAFKIDNDAPSITKVEYKTCSGNDYMELTNGSRVFDKSGIQLRFSITEAHDIDNAYVTYYVDGDSEQRTDNAIAIERTGDSYIITWNNFSQNVSYKNLGLKIEDEAGNPASWESIDTCFLVDTNAPVIETAKYKTSGTEDFIDLTDGIILIDQEKIQLSFDVKETSDIQSASISYNENGNEERQYVEIAIPTPDGDTYHFEWDGFSPDVKYTDLGFEVTDAVGYTATWGSATYILDHTKPVVDKDEIRYVVDGDENAMENETNQSSDITLSIPIIEANGINTDAIKLQYKVDGSEITNSQWELSDYNVLSFELPVNATYENFKLTLQDIAGNESNFTPEWKIVLDNTNPSISGKWIQDASSDPQPFEVSGSDCLIAKESIALLIDIQKRMDIDENSVRLCYKLDEEEDNYEIEVTSVEKQGSYGNQVYQFEFDLSQEANYTDFILKFKDVTGKEYKEEFEWSAIIDGTAPTIDRIFWTSEKITSETEVKSVDVLVDSKVVKLVLDIDEKNIDKVELYSAENSDQGPIMIGVQIPRQAQEVKTNEKRFIFTINQTDYNYKELFFKIIDQSGNVTTYGGTDGQSLKVIIDQEKPQMDKLTYVYPQVDIWYRTQKTPLKYSFELKDYSEIAIVEMVTDLGDGTKLIWNLEDDCSRSEERDENGYYIYSVTSDDKRFATALDQNLNYYFVIRDCWGNELYTIGSKATVNMRVDNTSPSKVAYVKFTGDKDKFYNMNNELVEVPDNPYQYGNSSGTVFNQNEVLLEIYVADQPGENAINQAASGIVKAVVHCRYTEESIHASKTTSEAITYEKRNNGSAQSNQVQVILNDEATSMDKLEFKLDVTNSQKITSIDSIELWDAAGNYTKIEEFSGTDEIYVDYVLDDKAPELSHVIPGSSSGYSIDQNIYYYNTNTVDISVTIKENNFYPDEVIRNLKAGEATKNITMSDFQGIGDYNYKSRLLMNEGDGIYRFTMSYTDRSQNVMIFQGNGDYVSNGTYTSPVLILDTTAPVVNIRYYKGGQDITDNINSNMCFNGDVSAVISITEVNFDPELVQIDFGATDAGDNHAFGITYNPRAWSQNGDTYSYTIPCTTEGHYSLTASCVDKAGNRSNGVSASSYIIDKTAPVVAIFYDTTTENGYYNTNRVATVTVTDQNFSPQAIEYVITSTGVQPVLSDWLHTGGSGCDGTNHVKNCKWSCQAIFSEDADYTFGFNCVDKAGNASAPVEEQAFTIDQTLPVIQVVYDNNDSLNDYYFKESRIATITITEHNFNSSDVNLVISSSDGDIHSPSAWRNSVSDAYVCEISYDVDGDYSFDISYTDLAGNEAETYAGDRFIIDLTAPELEIRGVDDRSANNGVVTPVVSYSDKNYDAENVTIRIAGVNHGNVALENSITINESGQTIEFMDFSHTQDMDDLYTLSATVTDKAGNSVEDSILFSVNRFGSVYIFSDDTKAVLDRFYTNQGPKLTVTEINVDTLEHQEISYSRDGNIVVLNQGTDYIVHESGSDYEWKQYTYEIAGSNFDAEGVYVVTLQSIDRAANDTSNRLKEKSIEFTVDKSAPSVVLGGIEDGGSYAETSRNLTIDAVDNIYLESVDVYLNGELAVNFDEDTLAEYHGQVNYEITEARAVQSVYIVARDAAGNETQTDLISFLISSNAFIRWFYNKPLFWGSICGVIAVTGGIFYLTFWRRRSKNTVKVQ